MLWSWACLWSFVSDSAGNSHAVVMVMDPCRLPVSRKAVLPLDGGKDQLRATAHCVAAPGACSLLGQCQIPREESHAVVIRAPRRLQHCSSQLPQPCSACQHGTPALWSILGQTLLSMQESDQHADDNRQQQHSGLSCASSAQ